MQNDQIVNLVNAILAGPHAAGAAVGAGADLRDLKVPSFDRTDRTAESWLAFKGNWTTIRELKGWNWEHSRNRLKASMKGDAHLAVSEIPIGVVASDEDNRNNEADARGIAVAEREADARGIAVAERDARYPLEEYRFNRVMRAYEKVFLMESGTSYARTAFQTAAQTETESIQDWHARLKILYRRAHPTADLETTPELIHRFVQYIRHPQVVAQTKRADPQTLTDALKAAAAEWSVLLDMQALSQARPGFSKGGINMIGAMDAMSPRSNDSAKSKIRCFHCNNLGHMKRECRKLARELQGEKASFSSGGGVAGSASSDHNKKPDYGPRRGVHSMDDLDEEDFHPQVYAMAKGKRSGN
jgi:hypothetical protein